ncbi:MAG: ABC transporter substrate-binding protein [Bacillota bacterium]
MLFKKKYFFIVLTFIIIFSTIFYFNQKNKEKTLYFYAHPEMQKIVNKYEKENPNINIKLIPLESENDSRLQYILSELKNENKQVDIIDTDVIWTHILAENDLIHPLDHYFSNKYLDRFLSPSLKANIIDSKLYGIPYRTDTGILYYRKDLLNKYNQKVPKTYEELIEISKVIQSKEDIYGYGGSWNNYEGLTCNALEIFWSYGGEINFENNKIIFNKKQNIKALKTMKKLVNQNIAHPEILNFYSGDLRKEFLKGNLVFMRDWPTGWEKIQESSLKENVGITFLPYGSLTGENKGSLGGWQLTVSKKSNYKDEAIDFIKFFVSYNVNKDFIINKSYLPVQKKHFDDKDVVKKMPFIKRNIALFSNSKSRPTINNYENFSKLFTNYLTEYLKNKIDLSKLIKKMETISIK